MFGIGPIELLILLVIGFFGIVGSIFWILVLIDCATNEPSDGNDKIIWILIILFTHCIGALIYVLVRRPKRKELEGLQ